jgi:hypothetical protein
MYLGSIELFRRNSQSSAIDEKNRLIYIIYDTTKSYYLFYKSGIVFSIKNKSYGTSFLLALQQARISIICTTLWLCGVFSKTKDECITGAAKIKQARHCSTVNYTTYRGWDGGKQN